MIPKQRKCPSILLALVLFALPRPGIWESSSAAMPSVQRMVLPNQLKLLFLEDHSLPFVTFNLLIEAGSWRDGQGEEGLANLTARTLLLGTSKHSAAAVNEELDFLGSGIDSSCDVDYAALSLRILKKDLAKGFDIFMETLTQPTFPEDEMRRAVESILGTLQATEDQPHELAEREFRKALFLNNPYAHPVEGTKESLGGIKRESVLEFYQSYYRPNNAILAISGDITLEEVKAWLIPGLAQWGAREIPSGTFDESFATGPKMVKTDRTVSQASIVLGHKGIERQNRDYYAVAVMNSILGGGGFASRLMEEIRIKRGLAYAAGSIFPYHKHPGSFQVVVQTKNSTAREVIDLVIGEMKRIQNEPVSDQELEAAKKYLIGSFPLRFATQQDTAEFFTQVEFFGLGLDYPEKYPSFIQAITRDDVQRVARAYLHPDNCIMSIVANLKEAGME